MLVIELLEPTYDVATEHLTYEALAPPPGEADDALGHLAARRADAELPETFGAVSLFIDDCRDADVIHHLTACWQYPIQAVVRELPGRGMRWNWLAFECQPCSGGWPGTTNECNATCPACDSKCYTDYHANCFG